MSESLGEPSTETGLPIGRIQRDATEDEGSLKRTLSKVMFRSFLIRVDLAEGQVLVA
jgi:hypothetical protein